MRIALVTETYPPELNGVATTVARTVEYLRGHGHEVDLIRPAQSQERAGSKANELLTLGVPLPMYRDLRFGWTSASNLVQRWQAQRPSVVHVATEGALGWSAVSAAKRLALPVTSDFRTNFPAYCQHYGLSWAQDIVASYLRAFHNRTDRSFAPTQETASMLLSAGFKNIEVISRGIDTHLFSPTRRDKSRRIQWGVLDHEPVVLYVGRLAAEKNVQLAFESFEVLRRRTPSARMVVVGDGPLKARLQQQYPYALFLGTKRGAELAECYASADIFLFPSVTDTFGNVLLEAMASGLLVLAFDCAAAQMHIKHGANGFLIRPGDSAGFVATASAAARDLARFATLRQQAHASALPITWDSVLRRFETSLLQVAQASGLLYEHENAATA